MDYVNASGNRHIKDDREDYSGARVFDGEDQGNVIFYCCVRWSLLGEVLIKLSEIIEKRV